MFSIVWWGFVAQLGVNFQAALAAQFEGNHNIVEHPADMVAVSGP
jgi:hypothetical protein